MRLTDLSIQRPVATLLLSMTTLIFGALAYQQLPISELPEIQFPVISVSAGLPGADPHTLAATVARPLENAFSSIPSVLAMTSSSTLGNTSITLQFDLSRDIDAASQDVQAAISSTLKQLPSALPSPPSLRKVNPADAPIFYLYLQSDSEALSKVDDYAQNVVVPMISTLPGVAQVNVYGDQKYAVRIQVDPLKASQLGLSMDAIATAINAANVNLATGSLDDGARTWIIRAEGQLLQAADYNQIIISQSPTAPVRLQDIGQAIDDVQNNKVGSWINGHRAVTLAVQRQPGSNTVAIADAISNLIPSIQAKLPKTLSLKVLYERATPIRKSIDEVNLTLYLAIVLVLGIIYIFLKDFAATFITSLILPLSLMGTFICMYGLGSSLDNLSLLALTLSVGFVVDDAIVMLENITRHRELGLSSFEAAKQGSAEIGFTLLSMTLSLVSVFIPIFFMPGFLGRILHEFASTLCISVSISGLVSLTLTPMLLSRMSPKSHYNHRSRFYSLYAQSLDWSFRHPRTVLASFVFMLLMSGWLLNVVHKGFIPSEDSDQIMAYSQGPDDISFMRMAALQDEINQVIVGDPNVALSMSSVGAGGARATTGSGSFLIRLKPKADRRHSVDEIIDHLRADIDKLNSPLKLVLQNPPALRMDARSSQAQYQYTLQALELGVLYETANTLIEKLKTHPEFRDISSDMMIHSPTLTIKIKRDQAASLGVSPLDIEASLQSAYASQQISTLYTDVNQYQVILELDPRFQRRPEDLQALYIPSPRGLVPLSNLVEIEQGLSPLTINHQGQLPAVTLSFNLNKGVTLGDATAIIEHIKQEMRLPNDVSASLQGAARSFQDAAHSMEFLLAIAILVVYLILGVLYESFIHPLTILSGLPAASFGALLALYVCQLELNLYSVVGLFMLIGIVKKNAIMIVDFALRAQHEGHPARKAIELACLNRIRPIMMTSLAAILAALPIALQIGSSPSARQPMGVAIVGGLVISQGITLYLTPVLYLYMDRWSGKFDRLTGTWADNFKRDVPTNKG